jgi:mannan endo-1,4-beta-mannosidase
MEAHWKRLLVATMGVVVALLLVGTAWPDSGRGASTAASSRPPSLIPILTGETGFVSRSGTGLVLDGRPFRFDGLNIYNANSRNNCWYSLGKGSALGASLTAIGPGQEVFRSWFFQRQATVDGARDWRAFDHTLAVAAASGEHVIATLTDQWGNCDSSDDYKGLSWYQTGYATRVDPGYLETYRQWVADVVTRYRDDPTIAMWQLVNEAEARDSQGGACNEAAAASALRAFTDDVGGLIHSLDPNHLVTLGTMGSGQCGIASGDYKTVYASPGTDVCEYHDYGKPSAALPSSLQGRINQCTALNKPIFVGESGIQTSTAGSLTNRAADFGKKFSAQFAAGVAGELVWDWRDALHGGSSSSGYEIGPTDPVIPLLAKY